MSGIREVPIGEVAPGAWLEADVTGPEGRVLLPSGCVLHEAALACLKRVGVSSLRIRAEPVLICRERALRWHVMERRMQHLFRCAGEGPSARKLLRLLCDYRLRQER
ncbi:hypothetical protein [Paludibacterium paludis]|uniref:Uncharacterized protein n=1 Tax=Paludibacterium paludis TaxID=1225769 RepID=A0A918P6U4_9NEIS|nr:hypothetical protein [Paludibacterium paludis]GGY27835.1 hypothetical protein GCM10011289_33980 [Paludibacterium paludis]